jgi:K+ transporter
VPSGGWFPLVVAAAVLAIAALWHWGCLLRLRAGRAGSVRLIEDVLWPEEGSGSAEQG